MTQVIGYAAKHSFSSLRPIAIERREPAGRDVSIEILFRGVCHPDVHQVKNEWMNTVYPRMPGHEIVGRVTAIANEVKKFKVGDLVGVGRMVDSCQIRAACREGLENDCEPGFLATYNGDMRTPGKENLTKSPGTSLIGGIAETQEVLDFYAEHSVTPEIKMIPIHEVNDAFAHLDADEVDFRYVIDMATLRGKRADKGLAAMIRL